MALVGDQLYIGNTDAVVAFPYETPGQTRYHRARAVRADGP